MDYNDVYLLLDFGSDGVEWFHEHGANLISDDFAFHCGLCIQLHDLLQEASL